MVRSRRAWSAGPRTPREILAMASAACPCVPADLGQHQAVTPGPRPPHSSWLCSLPTMGLYPLVFGLIIFSSISGDQWSSQAVLRGPRVTSCDSQLTRLAVQCSGMRRWCCSGHSPT